MQLTIYKLGYISGYIAFGATLAFLAAQVLQLTGVFKFPVDEISIYASSLLIALPLLLQFLALHYCITGEHKIWSHAALLFMVAYLIFVTFNYTVQLAVVVPAEISGNAAAITWAKQSPHSVFWCADALGYISLGCAALFAAMALPRAGFQGRVRWSLLAHSLTTPLLMVVYFYPPYSSTLLMLALPWAITAPLMMLLLAMHFRREYINEIPGHHLVYKHLQ